MRRFTLDYIDGYAVVLDSKTGLIRYASKDRSAAITQADNLNENVKP